MRKIISKLLVFCLCANMFIPYGAALSAAEENVEVQSILVKKNLVTVILSASAENVSFDAFTIEKPPKIVIDFIDSKLAVENKNISGVDGSNIVRVRSAQHKTTPQQIVRVVLDLESLVEYETSNEDNKVMINLHSAAGGSQTDAAEPVDTAVDEYDESDETLPDESEQLINPEKHDDDKSIIDNLSMQPVTLDFNQADLADVFRILTAKSGVNIIYGDDVEGDLTVHLEQVPFKEAFKTILSLKSLVAQQVGTNILRIITPNALSSQRTNSVTFWRVFPLNYANANEAMNQINGIRSAQGRKGTIQVDERTNSLIVADSPEGLDDVARLIKEIDIKPQQVLIDSRFVEVSLENRLDIGIDWGYYSRKQDGVDVTTIGEATIAKNIEVVGGTGDVITVAPLGAGVDAQIASEIGGFTFGKFDNESGIIAHLAALAREGKAKFLSNPKITTLNNKEATIWVGSQLPIRTTTRDEVESTTSVVYKMVGIELKVTPTINIDNRITLKVRPEVSIPDTASISPAGDVPINTRYAETTVLIRNNETLVIGGFIEENKTEGVDKVPLLGDIPILGQFFRSNTNRKSRRELLVFITPKIIED
ncbi:MAG: type IV pilus secretin PilQ [bacterium]